MEKKFNSEKNNFVLTPSGYLDMYNLPDLKEVTKDIEGRDVVIECDELRYMDSAVIGFFSGFADRLKETGNRLIFVNLKQYIKDIVDMVKLTEKFSFEYVWEGNV